MDITKRVPEHPKSSETGFASDLYASILHSFSRLSCCSTSHNAGPYNYNSFLQNELERLHLWGNGHSVLDGHFDRSLSQSPELRQAVLVRLYEMGSLIHYALIPRLMVETEIELFARSREELSQYLRIALDISEETHEEPTRDGQCGGNIYSLDDIPDLLEELKTIIDCLMDLSIMMNDLRIESNVEVGATGLVETFEVSSPQALVYCRKIRDQFPALPQILVERLGEANSIRSRSISMKSIQQEKDETEDVANYAVTELEAPSENLMSSSGFTAGNSSIKSSLAESVFDRRLRTTREDTRSVATFASINSTLHGINEGKRRVPPMPSPASTGETFECPLCSRQVNITDRSKWK